MTQQPSENHGRTTRSMVAQYIALSCLLGLIGLFMLWNLWLNPPTAFPPLITLAIQSLPLLAFVPGAISGSVRSMLWLCFVLLLYFIVAVPHLFLPATLMFGIIEVTLISVLFIAAMLFARWRKSEIGQNHGS